MLKQTNNISTTSTSAMSETKSLSSLEKTGLQTQQSVRSNNPTDDALVIQRASSESRIMEETDGFRPSILTPIHEVPMRSRLHTAETDLIHNHCTSAQQAKVSDRGLSSVEQQDDETLNKNGEDGPDDTETTRDDTSSVISSLSKDDSLRPRSSRIIAVPSVHSRNITSITHRAAALPPTEVSIPTTNANHAEQEDNGAPEWLHLQRQKHHSSPSSRPFLLRPSLSRDASAPAKMMDPLWKRPAPRVRTVFASPKVVRPTLGRNQSAPLHTTPRRMDFDTLASSSSRTLSSRTTYSSCGESMDALFSNNDSDSQLSLSPNSSKLLGGRKQHRKCHSFGNASIGQLSFITAPTTTSSSSTLTGSQPSVVRRTKSAIDTLNDCTGASDGCCSVQLERDFRKRNLVKEELKHVLNAVATPIKKLPLVKRVDPQQNLDLQRSKGCLT